MNFIPTAWQTTAELLLYNLSDSVPEECFNKVHVVQVLEEQAGRHSAHNLSAFTRRHTPSQSNTSSKFGSSRSEILGL